MAVEANHALPAPRFAAGPDRARRARAFAQMRRHSRLVRVLRIVLPLCAVATVGAYFLSSSISVSIGGVHASVKRIEVNRDRLRMIEPKLEGVTKKRGNYTLTAEYAEQNVADPSIVFLHEVRAEVTNPDKGWTRMTAPKGRFDTKQEMLVLTGEINVAASSGLTSRLTRADIDMKSQRVVSNEAVAVKALNGTINANTMEILMAQRLVHFRGNVRVHLYKRPVKSKEQVKKQ